MEHALNRIPASRIDLLPGLFTQRKTLNRRYLLSLRTPALLQNYHLQARLCNARFGATQHGGEDPFEEWHWGWESPTCQVRGHFLGHWLSAAAHLVASDGDAVLKAKADEIVAELARCQARNGGEWAGSIPPDYLEWTARGQPTWAPHYVVHKTLMGLYDLYALAGNQQALEVMVRWARWFHRWTGAFTREQMDDLLDVETGGMLEVWSDLYGVTGEAEHRELIRRYDRPRLFEPLLRGEDALTNRHANTTIPEAQGAARAYEVTGEERWRAVAEAYWRCAVTERGAFCTGGQTSGEIWTPPHEWAARLSDKNQEHCTVYNMMRLADYLLRWSGDPAYVDYIERNLYNGVLAQQHPQTGMISYFLPLEPGAHKRWGSPTRDFWCCHGSLIQAHTLHDAYVYYESDDGLTVAQYIDTELAWERAGTAVQVTQRRDNQVGHIKCVEQSGPWRRPRAWRILFQVRCAQPTRFALRLRLPEWLAGPAGVQVNDEAEVEAGRDARFYALERTWGEDTVRLELPWALTTCPIPDDPQRVAFLEGPVVLAALCDEERTLYLPPGARDAAELLAPANEREWGLWLSRYRVRHQDLGMRFLPLYQVVDQAYTVYLPVEEG